MVGIIQMISGPDIGENLTPLPANRALAADAVREAGCDTAGTLSQFANERREYQNAETLGSSSSVYLEDVINAINLTHWSAVC